MKMTLADRPYLCVDHLFLLQQHLPRLKVSDPWDHGALHYRSTLVVLDVSHPFRFLQSDFFCESLFFEISDGVVVRVREKVHDIGGGLDIVLQVIHHMRAISFDLLIRGYRAKDNLGECSSLERPVCDSTG